ncbi:MAG: cellulase family glycosylhydrolase [Oscillospiraceae bacterium]|nr:cellulase family glycosylhydrolase [Oscillospiraceae bacterium]
MQRIQVQGQRLIDEQGRERIFRGVNVKCGNEPEKYLSWLDEAFFQRSAALGLQLLRLGVCWETFEPAPGEYDEEVLRKLDRIFGLAAQYGVYVFLDMHQDLYSSFGINAGDGAPVWACLTDGYKAKHSKFVWAEGYFWGKAVQRGFDHFWENSPVHGRGIQDHYEALWQLLARRYGDHPAFFGFDFMNEPFPGTPGGRVFRKLVAKAARVILISPTVKRARFLKTYLNKKTRNYALDVLTPAVMAKVVQAGEKLIKQFDAEKYNPFTARMTKAVREVTSNGIVFVEQNYYSNIGVRHGVMPPEGEANACYSPHAYDFTVDTPAYAYANNARAGFFFERAREAQQRMNVPVIVGEWGGGGEGESFFPHIQYLLELFDSFHWSDTYFAYTEGLYDQPIMRLLSRPTPVAVNGVIKSHSQDWESNVFTLEFTQPAGADPALPTELYLPSAYQSIEAGSARVEEESIPHGDGRILKLYFEAGEHKVVVKL